jgi:hypothetical protein
MNGTRIILRGWLLLLAWVVANGIGWAVGTTIGVILTWGLSMLPGPGGEQILPYAVLISIGVSLGISESVVLNRFKINKLNWVSATILGITLYTFLAVGIDLVGDWNSGIWDDIILTSFFGLSIGICQWWILKDHQSKSWIWILANWLGSLTLVWSIFNSNPSLTAVVFRGTILGILMAVIPGIALVWFFGYGEWMRKVGAGLE